MSAHRLAVRSRSGAILPASPAFAQSATPWDRCISVDARPAERVAACTGVIDGKIRDRSQARGRLLHPRPRPDRAARARPALADLDEAIETRSGLCVRLQQSRPRLRVQEGLRPRDRGLRRGDPASNPKLPSPTTIAATPGGYKGDLDRAIADFDEAIRLDPAFALAYGNRGNSWHQQKRLRPRDRGLQRADQDCAEPCIAYIARGNAYRDTEQLERAAADYACGDPARAERCARLAQSRPDPPVPGELQGRDRRLRQGAGIRSGGCVLVEQSRPGQAAPRTTGRARSRTSARRWRCGPGCIPRPTALRTARRRSLKRLQNRDSPEVSCRDHAGSPA